MHSKPVTVNLREWKIVQFDSIDEARENMPDALLLNFINMCWQNVQAVKLMDAMKNGRRGRGRYVP